MKVQKKPMLGTLVLIGSLTQFFISPLLTWNMWVLAIETNLKCSRTEVSVPFFLASLLVGFSGVAMGFAVKRLGVYRSLLLSLLIMGLGLVLASRSRSLQELVTSFGIVYGLGVSIGSLSSLTLGSILPKSRGTVTGVIAAGVTIGMISLLGLNEVLANWRLEFLIVGLSALAVGTVAMLHGRSSHGKCREEPVESEDDTQVPVEVKLIHMLKRPLFYLIWLSYMGAFLSGVFVCAHLVPLAFKTVSEITLLESPVLFLGISNMVGRLISGRLIDVVGRSWIYALYLLSILGCLTLLLTPVLNSTSQLTLLLIGVVGVGLSYGGFIVSLPVMTRNFFGQDHLFINYGVLFTSYGLAGLLGSVIAGYIYDTMQSYSIVLLLCIALNVAGMVLFKLASFLQGRRLARHIS
jgi:OFA family oxalate/formate antiporter-like MFS transporter